jgi:hypothetical protein
MGFDTEQFLEEVHEELLCLICSDVAENARTACDNGHLFCFDCITPWIQTNGVLAATCPGCRQPIYKVHPSRGLDKIIAALPVRCSNVDTNTQPSRRKQRGCVWTGPLEGRTDHLQMCPFEKVTCTLPGCIKTIRRDALADHEASCQCRIAKCTHPGCGADVQVQSLEKHQQECWHRLQSCSRGCTAMMKAFDVQAHLTSACPNRIVACDFASMGCHVTLEHKSMAGHLTSCLGSHIRLTPEALADLQKTSNEMTHLRQRCDALEGGLREMAQLKQESERGSTEMALLRKRCETLEEACIWLQPRCSQGQHTVTVQWTIPDYLQKSRLHPTGEKLSSESFPVGEWDLQLAVFPNGLSGSADHLAVYICHVKGPNLVPIGGTELILKSEVSSQTRAWSYEADARLEGNSHLMSGLDACIPHSDLVTGGFYDPKVDELCIEAKVTVNRFKIRSLEMA